MKNVYIIEDQTILRDLLLEVLKNVPGLDVVGTNTNGLIGYEECLELKPDFIVLDLILPGMDGLEILKQIKKKQPSVRVLVFSANFHASLVRQVVEAGAEGFIEKTAGLDEFKKAIEALREGQNYFGPTVVEVLRKIVVDPEPADRASMLTSREREILKLVADSLTSKEIASKLGLSIKTVQNHRTSLMKKLGVHNVAGLLKYAMEAGLTEPPTLR